MIPRSEKIKKKISESMKKLNQTPKMKEYWKNKKSHGPVIYNTVNIDTLLKRIQAGDSLPELAEHFGVHFTTLSKRIRAYGLPKPRRHSDKVEKNKTWLQPMGKVTSEPATEPYKIKISKYKLTTMLNSGKTVLDMANKLDVSKETIYRRLKEFGLPTYTHKE